MELHRIVLVRHSNRRMPNWSRTRRSARWHRLSGEQRIEERRVRQEEQATTGSEQPGGLGDPEIRVAPEAGAVLREREVEARRPGTARLRRSPWTSGNSSPCSALEAGAPSRAAASELSMPTTRAPRRASQADQYAVPQPSSIDVEPGDVRQDAELALRDAPDPPARVVARPAALARLRVVHRVPVPGRAVAAGVLGQLRLGDVMPVPTRSPPA